MSDASASESKTLLGLSPEEREARGVGPEDVRDALHTVMERGSREEKILVDCSLPELDFDYRRIEGENRHPVVFRECSVDGVSVEHADVNLPVRFEACTLGGLSLEGVHFEYDLAIRESTVTGDVDAFESRFGGNATFTGTSFAGAVSMDEAVFADEASFVNAAFEREASFRTTTFHGMSNELGDNADFSDATFEESVTFRQATLEATTFERVTFAATAGFEEANFDGDANFADAAFHGEADFDEVDFGEDVAFRGAAFHAPAVFRGAEFEGGARTLHDDASFADVAFREDANFRAAQFRYVDFEEASFGGHAMFEEAWFDADADFIDCAFEAEADFDEARFGGDADFSGARFASPAVFRGARFEGQAQHLEKSAGFGEVHFEDDADFDNATFSSADFEDVRFGGVIDFAGAEFLDDFVFEAASLGSDTYVDFTEAVLKEGTITQPADRWVRYDLTQASVGDVAIAAERADDEHELLDHFRFCNTEFNEFDGYEFDFSAHTYYLDRNNWNLHEFDGPPGNPDYALEMTPETVETTYLKAKNAASDGGYVKAAGEFRVKRQRFARRKHTAIARDTTADLGVRASNLSRSLENQFLDVTCGYGMRLGRILAVFVLAPLVPALLYTFGGRPFLTGAGQLSSLGQLATAAGQVTFYENLYFSYITFLTIGYGGIGPKGALARLLAGLEVYLSVVLGGLVLYALIKRSEL